MSGSLTIRLDDGEVTLGPGQLYVVPWGVQHQPCRRTARSMVLIEPSAAGYTGDTRSQLGPRVVAADAEPNPVKGIGNRALIALLDADNADKLIVWVRIGKPARNHGIVDDHTEHAIRNAMRRHLGENLIVLIGPAFDGWSATRG